MEIWLRIRDRRPTSAFAVSTPAYWQWTFYTKKCFRKCLRSVFFFWHNKRKSISSVGGLGLVGEGSLWVSDFWGEAKIDAQCESKYSTVIMLRSPCRRVNFDVDIRGLLIIFSFRCCTAFPFIFIVLFLGAIWYRKVPFLFFFGEANLADIARLLRAYK